MLPSLSVIICTHNGRSRIGTTLDQLSAQRLPGNCDWEIIVVDNGSTDGTGEYVREYAAAHTALPLIVVEERRLGLVHARLKSYTVASKDIIVFVDDDNWLAADYLRHVAEVMEQYPHVGGLGGFSVGEFEAEPPSWFKTYQRWYAISGPPPHATGGELTETDFIWGAGAAIRRKYIQRIVGANIQLVAVGRQGGVLTGGDDHELCYLLKSCGARLFVSPLLQLRHYMPAARISWPYLRKLHYGEGVASVALDLYRLNWCESASGFTSQIRKLWLAQVLNVLTKLLPYIPVLVRAKRTSAVTDPRILKVELYLGRLAALWRDRRDFPARMTLPRPQL